MSAWLMYSAGLCKFSVLVSFGIQKNVHLNSQFQRPFAPHHFLVITLGHQAGDVASF